MFKFGVVNFFSLELFDNLGHLCFCYIQRRLKLFTFILRLKIFKFKVFGLFLELVNLPSEPFYFLVIELSVNVEQLDFKPFIGPFKFVDLVAFLLVLFAQLVILDFELFENPHFPFNLLLVWVVVLVFVLFIDRMRKRRVNGCQLLVH